MDNISEVNGRYNEKFSELKDEELKPFTELSTFADPMQFRWEGLCELPENDGSLNFRSRKPTREKIMPSTAFTQTQPRNGTPKGNRKHIVIAKKSLRSAALNYSHRPLW